LPLVHSTLPSLEITMSPKETAQTHLLSCSIRPAPHRASTAASPPTPSRSLLCYLLCSSATTTLPLLLCSTRIHAAFSRWPEAEATRGSLLDSGDRRGRHWRGRSLPARGGERQPWIWRWGRSSRWRHSSFLPAPELPPLRGLGISHGQPHAQPPPFLLLPNSSCSSAPPDQPHARTTPILTQHSCRLTWRGVGVHLLSRWKAVWLPFCLGC
jgi:hypothetical protein